MQINEAEGQKGESQAPLNFENELSELALLSRNRLFEGLQKTYSRYLNARGRFGYPGGITAFSADYIAKAEEGVINVSIDGADISYLVRCCKFSGNDTLVKGLEEYMNQTEASV